LLDIRSGCATTTVAIRSIRICVEPLLIQERLQKQAIRSAKVLRTRNVWNVSDVGVT
jgi:hypothetical protein